MNLPEPSLATASTAAKGAKGFFSTLKELYLWIQKKRYPKAPRNSTGIVIGIITEDDSNREQVKNDFIRTLESLLESSKSERPFRIVNLPYYHTEKIKTIDDATKVLTRCRSKFIMWGIARKRNIDKKPHLVLDLLSAVRHNEIIMPISNALALEMKQLLPKRRLISEENDLIELEVNAVTIDLAARYVIAQASALSEEEEYALELFEELQRKLLQFKTTTLPEVLQGHIELLRQKVIVNLYLLNTHFAKKHQFKWRKTRDINDIDKMVEYLKKADLYISDTYSSSVMWSLYHFIKNKDTVKARDAVEPWKQTAIADATWAFNNAFLHIFDGRLRDATRIYKIAFRRVTTSYTLLEIEEFQEWMLSEHPEKFQIYYSLGLINYFGKGEDRIAKDYFEKFLEKTPDGLYKEQVKLVYGYLEAIKTKGIKKSEQNLENKQNESLKKHSTKGKPKNTKYKKGRKRK